MIRASIDFVAAWALLSTAVAPATRASDIRFTDVTDTCGINFTMTCGHLPATQILEVNGGGIALLDFDNDGDLDVFVANGATMEDPEHGPGCRLYANRGDGTFEDVTARMGIDVHRWAMGVAVGDYDGDGWDDIYITCYGPDILLHNDGGRHFTDVTAKAGLGDPRWGTSAAFADLDGDGDLDLYVANYLEFDVKKQPSRAGSFFLGVNVMAGPRGLKSQQDSLYENLGDGRFREISQAAGCAEKPLGYGLGVRIVDFDGDGRPDIFVGNDSTENYLYHNLGNMKFEEIGVETGVATSGEGDGQASMGIGIADVDGNDRPDIFTTNFSSDTNTLHLNLDSRFFLDQTSRFGLGLISRPFLGWGCGFYDFDGDGDEDLFIANGHVYPETDKNDMDTHFAQNILLFDRVGPRFERITDAGPMCATIYHGRATAFGDIDGDGDVDVIMTTLNGQVHVFRNDSPPSDRLVVQLDYRKGNPRGYGSKLELTTPAGTQRRWITGGGSFQSVDAPAAYFGLRRGAAAAKRSLNITWPDGKSTHLADVAINRRLLVHRESGKLDSSLLKIAGLRRQ